MIREDAQLVMELAHAANLLAGVTNADKQTQEILDKISSLVNPAPVKEQSKEDCSKPEQKADLRGAYGLFQQGAPLSPKDELSLEYATLIAKQLVDKHLMHMSTDAEQSRLAAAGYVVIKL